MAFWMKWFSKTSSEGKHEPLQGEKAAVSEPEVSALWNDLTILLGSSENWSAGLSADQKIEVLARIVANLVDEVEILREFSQRISGLSHDEWLEEYRKQKMWLLYSSAGMPSACIQKYVPYLRNAQATAKQLRPVEAERKEEIRHLMSLT